MRSRSLAGLVILACASGAAPAFAQPASGNGAIVRIKDGVAGLPVITLVCNILGCTVNSSLDTPPEGGAVQPSSLFRVTLPPLLGVDALLTLPIRLLGVASAEPDLPVFVNEGPEVDEGSEAVQVYLWRRTPVEYFGTTVWEGYLQQPATSIVKLPETQCVVRHTGGGIVAVIDTGIDPEHPALAPRVIGGWDFTRNIAGGDERNDLEEPYTVQGGSSPNRVNQASAAVLDQASAAVLDGDPALAAYGHGTMVAGVVHLFAPNASLMPLKAFRADGTAQTSDILRAIYFASQRDAKVINMSFSRATSSPELARAIDYARQRGVIPVSSAGNDGACVLRYPAALSTVLGIGSTSNEDVRSSFSNYGSQTVYAAAPGEGIITTYPGATYAATWGTSFSTPIASAAVALMAGIQPSASYADTSWALSQATPVGGQLGYGRIDLLAAIEAVRSRWNVTGQEPGPAASCEAF